MRVNAEIFISRRKRCQYFMVGEGGERGGKGLGLEHNERLRKVVTDFNF